MNKYRISILASVVITLLCAGCQSREEAVSQSTIHQIQTPIATNISYQSEEAPDGVHFLNKADSLDALRRQAKADLTWTDPDGAPIFLWIKHNSDQSHWTFTLDEAHFVTQDRNTFWCFIDNSDWQGFDPVNPDPIDQFLTDEFVRRQIDLSYDNAPVENQSYAKFVSKNKSWGVIFEIIYCSNPAADPILVEVKTYCIYISIDGKCHLVTNDLGHSGWYPNGWPKEDDGIDLKVIWIPVRSAIPFKINLRIWNDVYAGPGDSEEPDYQSYQDGVLIGDKFPLTAKISAVHYVESDGTLTLESLAEMLYFYYTEDGVSTNSADQKIIKIWASELKRLNPTIGLNQHIPKGQRIITIANEDEFNDSIYERVRNEINSDK